MLIEIHMIQNHSPANLNRDDLGAPKTCYFGGALRSRISSQCLKRSIRTSEQFEKLCSGVRTRQLARLVAEKVTGKKDVQNVRRRFSRSAASPPRMRTRVTCWSTPQGGLLPKSRRFSRRMVAKTRSS
jgi:hypothetical protein